MDQDFQYNRSAEDAEILSFFDDNEEEISLEVLSRRIVNGRNCILTAQLFDSEAEASQYSRAETLFFFWESGTDENDDQIYDAVEDETDLDAAVVVFQDILESYLAEP